MGLLNDVAPEAHDKLQAIPHELWAYYASRGNVCWDQLTTNPAETGNSLLLDVRYSRKEERLRANVVRLPMSTFCGMCDVAQLSMDC